MPPLPAHPILLPSPLLLAERSTARNEWQKWRLLAVAASVNRRGPMKNWRGLLFIFAGGVIVALSDALSSGRHIDLHTLLILVLGSAAVAVKSPFWGSDDKGDKQ